MDKEMIDFLFYCFFGFLILQTVFLSVVLVYELYELFYYFINPNFKTNDVGPK
jgi:hypothetical protein